MKVSSWTKSHKLKKFDIIPAGGGVPKNLMGQLAGVKYHEDVIDPSIHIVLSCYDTYGFLNEMPIRSGMNVHLQYDHPSQKEGFRWDESTEPLVITNINSNTSDTKREVFNLTLATRHAISNHTTRVWEKYTDKISDTVSKILKDKLEVKEERLFIDETSNKYEFTGNYRRPLFMISSLCKKSIPTGSDGYSQTKGSSGFLFYETQDGYSFLDVNKTFGDADGNKSITKYQYASDKNTLDDNNFYFSSPPEWVENHDIIKKLRSGQYKAANYYYDVLRKKPMFEEYSLKESLRTYLKLSNEEELIPAVYADAYSRITFGFVDEGTMTPAIEGQSAETPQDKINYEAQSSARYSALFSQMLNVTIPMNLSLRAGQVIFCEFAKLNIEKPTRMGKNPASGLYMIARLSHEFGDKSYSGLTLVRDSFQNNTKS